MFYIYHIPERNKIGVSDDVPRRMKEHKWTGPYEILETHTCDVEAGKREKELQKQYGYKVDIAPYHISRRNASKAGKLGGKVRYKQDPNHILRIRPTWATTSKYRDPEKVKYNAKHNGGTNKHRDCIHCGRTVNLMNIGRHEVKCARDMGITP